MGTTNVVVGCIQGTLCDIVVDTGSREHSFISRAKCDELGVKARGGQRVDLIFGNGSNGSVYEFIEVVVSVEEWSKKVRLKVLDNLPTDVVLGLDSLSIFEVYYLLSKYAEESDGSDCLLFTVDEEINLFPLSEEEKDFQMMIDRSLPEVKDILLRWKHVFKIKVGDEPADISALKIDAVSNFAVPRSLQLSPRRFSYEDQETIAKEIDELEKLGIVTKCTNDFHSQLTLVPKKDGSKRMCIDFRVLNTMTQAVTWPLPHLQDLLHYLRGNQFFGVLDLSCGYWQMPVAHDSRRYTTFISERGTYQFNRVPFGLKNAPSLFQKALATEVLDGLIYNICLIYIDDLVIFGRSKEEFVKNLEIVLERLASKRIRVKARKSIFGVKEISYLGHLVSGTEIKISDERRTLFDNYGRPEIITKLRSFLGSANYFRNHIANYAQLAGPLYDLLPGKSKKDMVDWTEETNTAFIALKQAVIEAPSLFHLQKEGQIVVYSDASDSAIGGFITQIQDGIERPIIFLSRRLSETESRYCTIEREMLAIMDTILHSHVYLSGKKFVVRTDHKPLLNMLRVGENKRVERMKLRLMEYEFSLEHIAGEENIVADSLSRLSMLIENDISGALHDSKLAKLQKAVESGMCLVSKAKVREASSIAEEKRSRIRSVHNAFVGHHGVQRTVELLKELGLSWESMQEDVEVFLRACPNCAAVRSGRCLRGKSFRVYSEAPNKEWSGDSIGPLSMDLNGFIYILVIVEMFSGFVHLRPIKTVGKEECSEILYHLFCHYGAPQRFRADNAGQFKNNLVKDLLDSWSVESVDTIPYNSRDNASVEVRNREVRRHLAALETTQNKPWSYILPRVQLILNSSARSDIHIAPADILFGHFHAMGNIRQFVPREHSLHLQENFIDIIHDVNLNAESNLMQTETEEEHVLNFGDYVYIRNETRSKSDVANKIWIGPYMVMKVDGNSVHVMGDGTGELVRHISKVKLFDGSIQDEVSDLAEERRSPHELVRIESHDASRGTQRTVIFKVKYAQEPNLVEVSYADANFKDSPIFREYCLRYEELKKFVR